MRWGVFSGALWGLDTVVLGLALSLLPFLDAPEASLASALLHDAICAIILFAYMALRGRLKNTLAAIKTRSGKAIALGALLGGPFGMTGYLIAINNIGPGFTAIISTFYPAVGTFLAYIFLKERMRPRQILALLVALGAIVLIGYSSTGVTSEGNPIIGIVAALACVFGWGSEAVILAWGMNDEPLPEVYGGPLRLRADSQHGYKMVKWVRRLEWIHDYHDVGDGQGGSREDSGLQHYDARA